MKFTALLTYNSANEVIKITNKPSVSNAGPTFTAAFIYGADGNRVVQSVGTRALGESARTVYVGLGGTGKSIYERTTYVQTGKKEHVHFVYAGGAHGGNAFALRVVTEDQSGDPPPPTTKYYHFDHLGSVTAISDDTGNVFGTTGGANTTMFGYDAWGVRRNPDGTPASVTLSLQEGHREFTSHETVPNVGLVNMNGRAYDPDLGRFLTPDPNVQFVANLQSYNRYSYVLNNPLRYTDPTGYAWYSFLTSASFWIGMYESVVTAAACASTGGAGCLVLTGFMIAQMAMTSTAAILDGAPWQQVLKGDAIALGGMLVGLGAPADASPLARLLGGAVGGGVTAAVGTVLMGGNMDQLGQNALAGAITGAVAAGVASAVQGQNPLSLRSAAESQGGDPRLAANQGNRGSDDDSEVCTDILVKRRDIHLLEGDYGHWWVETESPDGDVESYGWYPKHAFTRQPGEGSSGTVWDVVTGTEGELNAQSWKNGAGTITMDPHQGDPADTVFNPRLSPDGPYSSCSSAAAAIRDYAQSFQGGWSYPFGWNCHSFQIEMMNQIGLQETSINKGLSP